MKPRTMTVVLVAAGVLGACAGGGEAEQSGGRETPLPAPTPIGGEDVQPGASTPGVVDPGEVPDSDRDGVPDARDTAHVP